MNYSDDVSPRVESILDSARGRPLPEKRVDVDSRDLSGALARAEEAGRRPVIAELKPTSPTTDGVREGDPVELATRMVEGGAAALSVLTEPEHFGGSVESLRAVREAVDVPVLRKDFLLEPAQLDAVEADTVLLIARFLEDLEEMVEASRQRGMEPLVEVHDRAELDRALAAGAELVGVNNRDLARLEVDLSTFEDVAPHVPGSVTLIAESGIATTEDARRMRRAGADGLLVGSAIMDGDPEANTRALTRKAPEADDR